MDQRPARLLLFAWAATMLVVAPSCLLPPDGSSSGILGPYAPEVDLQEIYPRSAQTLFDVDCAGLTLEANAIVDLDSEQLLFRWVANNGADDTKWIDDEISVRDPGEIHQTVQPIDHEADLQLKTGVVSLLITDAPGWEIERPNVPPGEPADLSGIVESDPDNPDATFHLTEVRWTFKYEMGSQVCDPKR